MKPLVIIVTIISTVLGVGSVPEGGRHSELIGDNVCIEQVPVNKTLNITYTQTETVKVYEACLKLDEWPPKIKCPKWKQVLVSRWKLENVTRIINNYECCNGYQEDAGRCAPVCGNPCLHGTCIEPDVCSCQPGFSGSDCGQVGCPEGNWGQDCSKPCPCQNGGLCEPNTGTCICLPGWDGLHCQDKCDVHHYGKGCQKKCECKVGHTCHHVTGDCNPCSQGKFGLNCGQECVCSTNGTALCYHENGNCFCKPNFYGRTCEMYCPFGYIDGVCHKESIGEGSCACANDLYRCDEELGCVCKDGFDCTGGTHFIDFAQLQAAATPAGGSSGKTAAIVVPILLIALLLTILAVLYYRRRMKLMKKDLNHRNVRYLENSIYNRNDTTTDPSEMVIRNSDPLPEYSNVMNNSNNIYSPPPVATAVNEKEKNVNLNRSKLGHYEEPDCSGASASAGACAMLDELDETPDESFKVERDVNVFFKDDSPTMEKNNSKLADLQRKTQKTNVNVVINNISATDRENMENEGLEKENDDAEEDDTNLKTYVDFRQQYSE